MSNFLKLLWDFSCDQYNPIGGVMKFLILLCLFISFNLFAHTGSWTLVKKNAGPAVFVCPEEIVVEELESRFSLKGDNVFMDFVDLNLGSQCQRRQNGSTFGTLTCASSLKTVSDNQIVYSRKICSTDLPFVSTCRPKEVSGQVVINTESTLTFSQDIGWEGESEFSCTYRPQL